MRLNKILEDVGQIDKGSFLKIVDSLSNEHRGKVKEIDKILASTRGNIKEFEVDDIARLFSLVKDDFRKQVKAALNFNDYHLDIVIDILIADGNSVMSKEWFGQLVRKEIGRIKMEVKNFTPLLEPDNKKLDYHRKRDYNIYRDCVQMSLENDKILGNRNIEISEEERLILDTLSDSLELSIEEVKLINYSVCPLKMGDLDHIITSLKDLGVIIYNRKTSMVFVPDEVLRVLRHIMGVQLPRKYQKRILRALKDTEINQVCKKHNIAIRQDRDKKIQAIVEQGIGLKRMLSEGLFKETESISKRKDVILDIIKKRLNLPITKIGQSLTDRVKILIDYYQNMDIEGKLGITKNGYDKLLLDLKKFDGSLVKKLRDEYTIQEKDILQSEFLIDLNIFPADVLTIYPNDKLKAFCTKFNVKTRGDFINNILAAYTTADDVLLENYIAIGRRDLALVKDAGIRINNQEQLGDLFEKVTRTIFTQLGFNVDESLRRKINTARDKMDVLLNLDHDEVIIIECKTIKDRDYNKYAAVSRQLMAYEKLCKTKGYRVKGTIIVSHDFTDEFVNASEYDPSLSLSLITSKGLMTILQGLKDSKRDKFPTKLLLKDGQLDEGRIVKALIG